VAKSIRGSGAHQFCSRLPTPASPDQSHDHKQQHGADGGSNDLGNNPSTEMETEPGKQQTGDEGTDDSNDNVANQTKARPLHDLAGQPACNSANQQYDEQTFSGNMHNGFLRLKRVGGAPFVDNRAAREWFAGESDCSEGARALTEATKEELPSAAAPPIGGAVAAARAVPRGLTGVIARMGSYVVVATPEIR
jgi:hypothetical protein